MILTVTLNAAIDRTVAVPNFRLGQRHRAVESRTVAGGKGVNVARALKLLGRPVIATGLVGGSAGTRIVERLGEESILNDFTRIGGESRTNLAVVDPTTGEQTEINERGPQVTPEEVDRFVEKLLYLAQGATICVLAGSIPPGCDPDVYARLVNELKSLNVTTVLDTDGEQMRGGLRAGPAVVVPNALEAEEAVGYEFNDSDDRVMALSGLIEMGAGEAIITSADGLRGDRRDRARSQALRGGDRSDGADLLGWLGGCVPGRLRSRSLRGQAAQGLPRVRRRLRGGVDPAFRGRNARPARGRADLSRE